MDLSEGEVRKRRSIALLQAQGIPHLQSLPCIESASEAVIRPAEEVFRRASCLLVISIGAVNRMRENALEALQNWRLIDALTPKERDFLESASWSERDRTQFSWRCEAALPLLWAVRMVEDLPYPDQILDLDRLGDCFMQARPSFQRNCEIRDAHDILDQADLIYRYHWAVRNAELKGRDAPTALQPGVVMERHHALNWLIGYSDQAWDEVTTDT